MLKVNLRLRGVPSAQAISLRELFFLSKPGHQRGRALALPSPLQAVPFSPVRGSAGLPPSLPLLWLSHSSFTSSTKYCSPQVFDSSFSFHSQQPRSWSENRWDDSCECTLPPPGKKETPVPIMITSHCLWLLPGVDLVLVAEAPAEEIPPGFQCLHLWGRTLGPWSSENWHFSLVELLPGLVKLSLFTGLYKSGPFLCTRPEQEAFFRNTSPPHHSTAYPRFALWGGLALENRGSWGLPEAHFLWIPLFDFHLPSVSWVPGKEVPHIGLEVTHMCLPEGLPGLFTVISLPSFPRQVGPRPLSEAGCRPVIAVLSKYLPFFLSAHMGLHPTALEHPSESHVSGSRSLPRICPYENAFARLSNFLAPSTFCKFLAAFVTHFWSPLVHLCTATAWRILP